jgi:hypothetical protein
MEIPEAVTDLKLSMHTKGIKQEGKDDTTSKKAWQRSSMQSSVKIG